MYKEGRPAKLLIIIFSIVAMLTGCTSFSGERLDAPYLMLLWLGAAAGGLISDFIWSADDAGNECTPWWEMGAWFFFTFVGAAAGYVKRFFLFSGLLIAIAVPVVAMTIITLIVRVIRKKRARRGSCAGDVATERVGEVPSARHVDRQGESRSHVERQSRETSLEDEILSFRYAQGQNDAPRGVAAFRNEFSRCENSRIGLANDNASDATQSEQ